MSLTVALSVYLPLMLVILALIAMCNGSETAITSVTPIRLKALITHSSRPKKQKDRFKKIYKLAREFNQTLAAILFASTLCNTALATIATLFFTIVVQSEGTAIWMTTLIIGLLVLSVGEIIPKVIAKHNAENYVFIFYYLIRFLLVILYPITWVMTFGQSKSRKTLLTEDELLEIVKIIEQEGVLEKQEEDLITSAIKFDETKVMDVMNPLDKVYSLRPSTTWNEVRSLYLKTLLTRFPIYNEAKTDFTGLLNIKSAFRTMLNHKNPLSKNNISPILKVYEDESLNKVLEKMQRFQNQMAAVYNHDSKQLVGLVTMEDLIEEIVGEIYDEHDITGFVKEVGNHKWLVNENVLVRNLFKTYLHLPVKPEWQSWKLAKWFNSNIHYNEADHDESANFVYENYAFCRISSIDKAHLASQTTNTGYHIEIEAISLAENHSLD